MNIEILNLYSNEVPSNSKLKGDHGQSFLFRTEDQQILMDVGAKGDILLHNMKLLGIDPNEITKLILSHGHYDHTGGLPEFLDSRDRPIEVIAHPMVPEKKRAKMLLITKNIGFPNLTEEQEAKLIFTYTKDSMEVIPGLFTTGEISPRNERDGTEPLAQHLENGKWVPDPVWDDVSVILDGKDGQVIITGCAHTGILNILNYAKQRSDQPIKAIIGGTHMVRYTKEEVIETGKKFESTYDNPDLYLNHCTDKLPLKILKKTPTIKLLKNLMGDKVKNCYVGTSLIYEI